MSVQPSQPSQAMGTEATRAANGTRMNRASATCSLRDWVSPPMVARAGAGVVGGSYRVVMVLLGGVTYGTVTKTTTFKRVGARRRRPAPVGAGSLPAMP